MCAILMTGISSGTVNPTAAYAAWELPVVPRFIVPHKHNPGDVASRRQPNTCHGAQRRLRFISPSRFGTGPKHWRPQNHNLGELDEQDWIHHIA